MSDNALDESALERLQTLRTQIDRTAIGPWCHDEQYPASVFCDDTLGSRVADCAAQFTPRSKADERLLAEYLVALHNALPSLLASLRASRKDEARHLDAMEFAWGIIANAGGGNWELESADWQEAAAKWRESYLSTLGREMQKRARAASPSSEGESNAS